MRLLLATREYPPYIGGIGTYVYELASAAAGIGHEVEVIAPAPPPGKSLEESESPARLRITRFTPRGSPLRDVLPLRQTILRRLAEGKYDLVHPCDRASLLACSLTGARSRKGVPVCTTVYGSEVIRWRSSIFYRWLDPRLFGRVARIAAISAYTLRELETMLGLTPRRSLPPTRHIPLALSNRWLESPGRPSHWRPHPDRIILGTVGRLDERKGHFEVIAACGRMPEAVRARLTYAVVGPGPREYVERLQAAAVSQGVTLEYLGAPLTDELPGLYRQMHVHVLFAKPVSHTIEGFGLVILEAGSSGVPTIATRLGGIPEVIEEGVSGLLVEPGDIQGLAGAIQRLVESPDLRGSLGAGARAKASARRWTDVARETYQFFSDGR